MNTAYKPATDQAVAAFAKVDPGVKIKVTYLTSAEIASVVPVQLSGGNGPDMFWMGAGSGGAVSPIPLAQGNKLLDLSDQPWVSSIASVKSEASYQGKVYGLPVGLTPAAVFYNSALFTKLGVTPPSTLAQLLTACKKISAAGDVPIALGLAPDASSLLNTLLGVLVSTPYTVDPNFTQQETAGTAKFATSAAWRQSFQSVLDMKNANCFPPSPAGVSIANIITMLSTDKSPMLISNAASTQAIAAESPGIKLDSTFPMPAPTAAQTRVLVYITPVMGINENTSNKAAALAFTNYLASPTGSAAFNTAAGQFSPTEATQGDLPAYAKGLVPYFTSGKTIDNPSAFWPNPNEQVVMGNDVVGLLTGQKTVDQALSDMDSNWAAPTS
jgi:raffinose/stachyose/melibiose transport system substrate-binding protein